MKRDNRKNHQGRNTITKNNIIIPEKKNNSVLFIIIAFCIPVLLYLQTINFGFTGFDDESIIINNIAFLSDFNNAHKAFLTDAFMNNSSSFYRPLQTLSYMIDLKLSGGNNTWMYHLTNILLLGLISGLLFLLLKRFLVPAKLALLSTLIFCCHPLFVSSIAWIPARGDLQLTFFSILSFMFLIEFLKKRKIIYLFLHWIAFTFALFSKETAAILPFLFIIYFFTFIKVKRFDRKYLFTLMLYAISGILWLWIRFKAIGEITKPTNDVFGLIPFLSNLRIIPESLTNFFLLLGIGPFPVFSFFKTFAGLGIIILIIIIFFKNSKRLKKEKVFCLFWFVILMLPPLLYKHPYMDYLDHRFFLPLIGILLFLLFIIPEKWLGKVDIERYWFMIAIIVLLCSFTFIKSFSYSNPMNFYNSAISYNSNSPMAYYGRGFIKNERNDFRGAIDDYNKAITICPTYYLAYYNRGLIKLKMGDNQGAIENNDKVIALNPNYADAYYNRGLVKSNIGDIPGAIEDYNKVIAISPTYYLAYYNIGQIKLDMGDYTGAIKYNTKVIAINPDYANAYNNRGFAKSNIGNYIGAIKDYDNAININPGNYLFYYNKGVSNISLGNVQAAINDFNKVISINPNYEYAYNRRGLALMSTNNFQEAINNFNKAIELNPKFLEAYLNKAIAKLYIKDVTGAIEDCNHALKLNPNDERALNLKAKAQQELQKISH